MEHKMWLIIGVSGTTCSGKSSLAHALHKTITGSLLIHQDEFFLPEDSKYHTWIPNLKHINWEIMSSFDMEKMHNAIKNIFSSDNKVIFSPTSLIDILNNAISSCKVAEKEIVSETLTETSDLQEREDKKCKDTKSDAANSTTITRSDLKGATAVESHHKNPLMSLSNRLANQPEISILIIEGILILNDETLANLCHLKYFMSLTKEQCWARRRVRTYNPPDVPGYFDQCVWPEYEKHCDQVFTQVKDIKIIDGTLNRIAILKEVLLDITKKIYELFYQHKD